MPRHAPDTEFDLTSPIDPRQLRLNRGSPASWRRSLLGACLVMSVFGAHQAAQARGSEVIMAHGVFDARAHQIADEVSQEVGPIQFQAMKREAVDMDRVVARAETVDAIHAQVEASTVYIVQLDAHGQTFAVGSGTMLAGTGRDGMLEGISVRHVVDAPNMLSNAADRQDFGQTMIFNSAGRLLGFMVPVVENLVSPGTTIGHDSDTPTMFRIDPNLPHNMALLRQIPGVPLYAELPSVKLRASFGDLAVSPGASGGGVIYADPTTGHWGLVGVVSVVMQPSYTQHDVADGYFADSNRLTVGHSLYGKISGNPDWMGEDLRTAGVGDGIVLGVGTPALLAHLSSPHGYSLTANPQFAQGQAFSFNFADNLETYTGNISLAPLGYDFDYASAFKTERKAALNVLKSQEHPAAGETNLQLILDQNRGELTPGMVEPEVVMVAEDAPGTMP
jgi:hypothetical protein